MKFHLPVISVGNLSVGGSGKSQLVILLIKSLQTDFNILVLTRGFNRISKLDLSSKKQALTVENFGDEPVMISNYLSNGEIIVSKNRTNFLIQNQDSYKGFIVILDDGYQHYSCLLYTSDAADERSSVDLGGRRIIKKNNKIRYLASRYNKQ